MSIPIALVRLAREAAIEVSASTAIHNNRQRSRIFVASLGEKLKANLGALGPTDAHVAWRGNGTPIARKTEFLFDVGIFRTSTAGSYREWSNRSELPFITSAFLVVESELCRNAQEVIDDFSKLLIADAEWKMLNG